VRRSGNPSSRVTPMPVLNRSSKNSHQATSTSAGPSAAISQSITALTVPFLDPVEILIETRPAALRLVEKLETLPPFELVDLGQHTQRIPPDITSALPVQVADPAFPVIVGTLLHNPSLRLAHD
jgi:hypothetical protein